MLEQGDLVLDSATVADKRTIRANDSVAWNDDADRVPSHRAADSLCGHLYHPALFRDRRRDVAVCGRLAKRNLQHCVNHVLSKRRQSVYAIRRRKARFAPAKVFVKPTSRLAENWQFALLAIAAIPRHLARIDEMQSRQHIASDIISMSEKPRGVLYVALYVFFILPSLS